MDRKTSKMVLVQPVKMELLANKAAIIKILAQMDQELKSVLDQVIKARALSQILPMGLLNLQILEAPHPVIRIKD